MLFIIEHTIVYHLQVWMFVFFFGNLSQQHFRTNQKTELVLAFLTDAPTEVDFPVLLPMVHDGTCYVT